MKLLLDVPIFNQVSAYDRALVAVGDLLWSGDWVLVTAAAGGVGIAAVQIAKGK